jgi:hypothetical protein
MQHLLRHLELYLSAAGLVVVILATTILKRLGFDPWIVGTITAVLVGIIDGIIFWLVRRRQQAVRLETIGEIQGMLQDLINNQLTIIETAAHLKGSPINEERQRHHITNSVQKISSALHDLSAETLHRWKQHYQRRT